MFKLPEGIPWIMAFSKSQTCWGSRLFAYTEACEPAPEASFGPGRWRRRQRRQRQLHWETRRGFPLWLPGDSPPCSCACKWCCYLAPGDENGRHIIQGAVTAAKQHITLWSTQIEHVGNLNGCICVYVFFLWNKQNMGMSSSIMQSWSNKPGWS